MGVSAAPLNHCLAAPQRLAAVVHQFLEAAEVGLLETKIFVQFPYEKELNLEGKKSWSSENMYFFHKKSHEILKGYEKL